MELTELSSLKAALAANTAKLQATEAELAQQKLVVAASSSEIAELRRMLLSLTARVDGIHSSRLEQSPLVLTDVYSSSASSEFCNIIDDQKVERHVGVVLSTGGSSSKDCTSKGGKQIELRFQGQPFDENGLVFFIGTQGNLSPFMNPHRMHSVGQRSGIGASMSSVGLFGSPYRFLNHKEKELNFTNNLPDSWMKMDIGSHRRMRVNHYCLRHGGSGGADVLRIWELQASNTGSDWICLKKHKYDQKLSKSSFSIADWAITETPQSSVGYRYFRIVQTGQNSGWNSILNCGGIELYGVLEVMED